MRHENRDRHGGEHGPGRSSQDQLAQARMAIAPHHEEVGQSFGRIREKGLGRPTSGRQGLGRRLNASWFLSMADARERIEQWRRDYNETRPHTALGGLTPNAFARQTYQAREVA